MGRGWTRWILAVLVGLQLPAPRVLASSSAVSVGSSVYVNVSVATLWVSADSPRAVDAPALSQPVHIRRWLGAMSTAVRRDLVGRIETQALYGDRLRVIGEHDTWLHVVVPGQPTSRDSRGYPGWLPRRQVTAQVPMRTADVATVTSRTAPLLRVDGTPGVVVSFGTRLPVIGISGDRVQVATPTGGTRWISSSQVSVTARSAVARPQTVRSVMHDARAFIGVPYLWGGRSGFAVDCSGFTGLVYGVHGVRLPRDANDQAVAGRAVGAGGARAGDLAFFSSGGAVSHVGFVTADHRLLNAPRTGLTVSVTELSSRPTAMRRYL